MKDVNNIMFIDGVWLSIHGNLVIATVKKSSFHDENMVIFIIFTIFEISSMSLKQALWGLNLFCKFTLNSSPHMPS